MADHTTSYVYLGKKKCMQEEAQSLYIISYNHYYQGGKGKFIYVQGFIIRQETAPLKHNRLQSHTTTIL